MATQEDGSEKEQAYTINIDGVTHYVSLTIYLEAGDEARLRKLMEANTWKLPAKFNPNEETRHLLLSRPKTGGSGNTPSRGSKAFTGGYYSPRNP